MRSRYSLVKFFHLGILDQNTSPLMSQQGHNLTLPKRAVADSTLAKDTVEKIGHELPTVRDTNHVIDALRGSFIIGYSSCQHESFGQHN
jgi:hypothetical protein